MAYINAMRRGRPQKTTRLAWVEAAAALLAKGGVQAVRVEAVARRLGVTKGGFYGYFKSRRKLLDAIVAHWEQVGTEAVIAAVEAAACDAHDRGERLWAIAIQEGVGGTELAIRAWARRDEEVRAVVKRVDDRRMQYLRGLFGDLGFEGIERETRCMLVYSLLIGDHFIAASHGRYGRKRVLTECRALLQRK